MPWEEVSIMSQKREFVTLAQSEEANIRELCRRFGISPTTGYKWLGRFRGGGTAGLAELARRPHRSPKRTAPEMERSVLQVRDAHPAWGGRKLRAWLLARGRQGVPSPSTITTILRRHGRIDPALSGQHRPWQRFEHAEPNQLWQMDFKGHFAVGEGRCHPLTVLDDHSRFALGLVACGNEMGQTVQEQLTSIFRRYGLPQRMVMDNGGPWGHDGEHPYTPLTVWLLRLGIAVSHGRPYHPQTQGKDERFHRTLKAEVLQGSVFRDLDQCQQVFDRWRGVYNFERPHEALNLAVPGSRYRVSQRPFPEELPPLEYGPEDQVRKVQAQGIIWVKGREYKVGKAFRGLPVAIRPTAAECVWNVYFLTHNIAQIDLREPGAIS